MSTKGEDSTSEYNISQTANPIMKKLSRVYACKRTNKKTVIPIPVRIVDIVEMASEVCTVEGPSTSNVTNNRIEQMETNCEEIIDSTHQTKNSDNVKNEKRATVICQICHARIRCEDAKRMSTNMEKSILVLDNCQLSDELLRKKLLERISRGIQPNVCANHFPKELLSQPPNGVKIIAKYRSRCFLCGKGRHVYELRQISTVLDKRLSFYSFNNITDEKKEEIEKKMKSNKAVVVCGEHFPPDDRRRSIKKTSNPVLIDERGRQVRVAVEGERVCETERRRTEKTRKLRSEGRLLKSCHWCCQNVSVSQTRGMPMVKEAIEGFFRYAKGSEEQENSLRRRIEEKGGRHCRVCYSHFPPEWAHCRGRYWHRSFFRESEQNERNREEREGNGSSLSSLPTISTPLTPPTSIGSHAPCVPPGSAIVVQTVQLIDSGYSESRVMLVTPSDVSPLSAVSSSTHSLTTLSAVSSSTHSLTALYPSHPPSFPNPYPSSDHIYTNHSGSC